MNITFAFKNFEPSDHLKEYASSRFEKMAKFIGDTVETDIQVNLNVEKFRHKAEVVLFADNLHLSAYEESEDMYATIDQVLDKLESPAQAHARAPQGAPPRRNAARSTHGCHQLHRGERSARAEHQGDRQLRASP